MALQVATPMGVAERPKTTLLQYTLALQQLRQDYPLRRTLSLAKAMLRPSLRSFQPDSREALKIKLDFLSDEIRDNIRNFFSAKYNMDVSQIALTANLIYEHYGSELSASAFVVFSDSFIANRLRHGTSVHNYYDATFSRLDGEIILAALAEYVEIQRQAVKDYSKLDDNFIAELPKELMEMPTEQIIALVGIGTQMQQYLIRAAVSNYFNFTGKEIPSELTKYVLPKPTFSPLEGE